MASARLKSKRLWQIFRLVATIIAFTVNSAFWLLSKVIGGIGNIQAAQTAGGTVKMLATLAMAVPGYVYAVVGIALLGAVIWQLVKDAGKGAEALGKAWYFRDEFEAQKEYLHSTIDKITESLARLNERLDAQDRMFIEQGERIGKIEKLYWDNQRTMAEMDIKAREAFQEAQNNLTAQSQFHAKEALETAKTLISDFTHMFEQRIDAAEAISREAYNVLAVRQEAAESAIRQAE